MTALKALGGTSDLLPDEAERWQHLEATARSLFRLYGFREVRTPILEEAQLFLQSLGAQAEIVTKQMVLFKDRGDREIALRPEGTASAVRAFIEKGLDTTGGLTRWYYLGPMFRAERPQAGRRRQFHQIGVELFGSPAPYQDAEVIQLLRALLLKFGIDRFRLNLNSLGCRSDRKGMLELVRGSFTPVQEQLCPECKERFTRNPLRILDCKEPECASRRHPVDLSKAVCAGCRDHFETVLQALEGAGLKRDVDYSLDPSLVRGLDYYTKTAFEVIHPDLGGAQNALGGGGRYDDLVESLGGVSTPAVGFAVGMERVFMVLDKSRSQGTDETARGPEVFVAALGEASLREGIRLLTQLRQSGISGVTDYEGRSLRRQLEQANRLGCRLVLMLGDQEQAKGVVTLKEMSTGEQMEVPLESCVAELKKRLQNQKGSDPFW